MKKIYILLFLLFNACASHDNKLHDDLVKSVVNGDIKQAKEIVHNENFYKDENSKLLKLTEQGSVLYLNSDYNEASLKLYNAQNLSKNLYTKSISANIKSIFNDRTQIYYGMDFENSYLRFYHALSNYHLFLTSGKQDTKYLNIAKNSTTEWYNLLQSFENSKYNKLGYKYDILQGIFAGFIHEQYNDVENKNIALSLYKQVKKELDYSYNIYPSFNKNSKSLINNYHKLSKLDINEINKLYITPTFYKKNLETFIDNKIKNLSSGTKDNSFFIIREGIIATKKAKKYKFKLQFDDVIRLSYINDIFFDKPNVNKQLFLPFFLTNFMDSFEYELPYMEQKNPKNLKMELVDTKGKIYEIPLLLTSPLSDFAAQEINSNLESERVKLLRNLIIKYITAGLSAYTIYNATIENSKNDLLTNALALTFAISSFKASKKLINNSNKVDTRAWKTLPNSIFVASRKLKSDTYIMNIYELKNNQKSLLHTQTITTDNNHNLIDIKI